MSNKPLKILMFSLISGCLISHAFAAQPLKLRYDAKGGNSGNYFCPDPNHLYPYSETSSPDPHKCTYGGSVIIKCNVRGVMYQTSPAPCTPLVDDPSFPQHAVGWLFPMPIYIYPGYIAAWRDTETGPIQMSKLDQDKYLTLIRAN